MNSRKQKPLMAGFATKKFWNSQQALPHGLAETAMVMHERKGWFSGGSSSHLASQIESSRGGTTIEFPQVHLADKGAWL
jgi:hypothetical protein